MDSGKQAGWPACANTHSLAISLVVQSSARYAKDMRSQSGIRNTRRLEARRRTAAAWLGIGIAASVACAPLQRAPITENPADNIGVRAAHTATVLDDGAILIAGGCIEDGCATATDHAALVVGSQVKPLDVMRDARDAHTATVLGDGRVLVAGGFSAEGSVTRSAELYDAVHGTWSSVGDLITPRGGHSAALLGDGRVLIAGGWVSSGRYTASTEFFDPHTGVFADGPSLPDAVDNASAITLRDGSVLVTGGQTQPGLASAASAVIFPGKAEIVRTDDLLTPRFKHAMVPLRDGRVLLIGGTTEDDRLLSSTEVFDPETLTFTPGPELISGRYKLGGAAAILPDGRVIVGGGGNGVEVIDVDTKAVELLQGAPSRMASFGTVSVSNGSLYLIGGYDENISLTGTFERLPLP